MMSRKNSLLLALFVFYAIARVVLSQPALARPRELADTTAYLRISQQPVLDADFWGSSRPFVFPLLLKVAYQDPRLAVDLQMAFSILAWGLLALAVSSFLRTSWLKPLSFALLLVLSLVPHLAGWDFTLLTESLSISWFVIFLAACLWLLYAWSTARVAAVIAAGLFLAFTRDTNAYLLLMFAGLLFLGVLLRWASPRTLVIVAAFIAIFLLDNASADLGRRWVFPLINITGRRILPDGEAVGFFERSCGMPVTPALLSMRNEFANGDDRAFYNDPELESFRAWLLERGKSCYVRWLLADPSKSLGPLLVEFWHLIQFRKAGNYFSRGYDPIIPYTLEPLLYPGRLALTVWSLATLAAVLAVLRKSWERNPLWAGFTLLCLPILPHLFITWHGDAMAPERHALSVGLQLALSLWLLVFLVADALIQAREREPIGDLPAPEPGYGDHTRLPPREIAGWRAVTGILIGRRLFGGLQPANFNNRKP
jgi:hypothetical protein